MSNKYIHIEICLLGYGNMPDWLPSPMFGLHHQEVSSSWSQTNQNRVYCNRLWPTISGLSPGQEIREGSLQKIVFYPQKGDKVLTPSPQDPLSTFKKLLLILSMTFLSTFGDPPSWPLSKFIEFQCISIFFLIFCLYFIFSLLWLDIGKILPIIY